MVPQLGAFIVKQPGEVLFSELLKRDDGVLRGLLCEAGLSTLEAAGEIDRFVFEARHAVERSESFAIEGFGLLRPGPNGTIAFVYRPEGPEGVAEPQLAGAAAEQAEAGMSAGDSRSASESSESSEPAGAAASVAGERRSAAQRSEAFHVSRSAKMEPDPSLRGLRYGKPPKTTDAYTYVDRPPRRRGDRFIWIALGAAVIALAAIAFGLFREARERQAESETFELLLPEAPAADVGNQTFNE